MRFYPFVFLPERMRTACDRSGANGNGASSRGTRRADNARGQFETGRFLFWTEDSRMHAAVDDKHYSYYAYDHSGGSCASREQSQACLSYAEMEQRRRIQRRLKLTGINKQQDVNAEYMNAGSALNEPTLYPSPYLVLTRTEYTKHYYAGTDRVAACLGGGGLDIVLGNNLTEPTAPAYSTPWGGLFDNGSTDPEEVIVNDTIVMLQEASTKLFEQSGWQVNQRELNGNELNCIAEIDAYHAELHRTIAGIPDRMETGITLDFDKFHDKVRDLKKIQHDEREYVYYYHGDHLGSASWITNHNGDAVQHLQYLPYGEPYVDKRTSGYSERFRFTGKERDEETGYGYFGARYMDHELTTMWLSVDPMADKYLSISPYAYCAWNPVKLVDPDGREIDDYFTREGKYLGSDNANTNYIRIISEATWNSIKDENENVNHDDANFASHPFSEESAFMSTEAQLAIYQHYNPTEYSLVEKEYNDNTSSNPGYDTRFVSTKEGATFVKYLEIKLKENRTKNSVGNAVCDNADEIISLFVHENDHIQLGLQMSFEDLQKICTTKKLLGEFESNAVNAQRNHSSWKGCRESFREGMDRYERSFQ